MSSRGRTDKAFSPEKPTPARMYDYFLGGYNNFESDRAAARKVMEINPDAPQVMRANRDFLQRVVGFLSREGIDQFLDLGSGMPTAGHVHEVARKVNPGARVVYVDIEPIAVRHGEAILEDDPDAAVVQADVRRPEDILGHPEVRRLLDFDRPVAVLLFCVLHFIPDDEEARRIAGYWREKLAPGSYLAVSHATDEDISPEHRRQVSEVYSRTANPIAMRSYSEVQRLFEGLDPVEPGLVYVPLWRPADDGGLFAEEPERSVTYGGVGKKP